MPLLPVAAHCVLVQAPILCHLDYCNSLFLGVSSGLLKKLQHAQNAATKLSLCLPRHDSFSTALDSLNWLPVVRRVAFKSLCHVHRAYYHSGQIYFRNKFTRYVPGCTLRATDASLLAVTRFNKTRTAGRAFSVAASKLWNTLPLSLRRTQNLVQFRKALKTWQYVQ